MSNYNTKAKRPNGKEFEEVSMIDDFFGRHKYGVSFPDGAYFHAEDCEFEEEVVIDNPLEDLLKEFDKEFPSKQTCLENENKEKVWLFSPEVDAREVKSFIQKSYEAGEQNILKEIEKIIIDHIDYLRDNYGDIMDIELLESNVLKKVQSLIKSYKVK
jgi:hypothetical protein